MNYKLEKMKEISSIVSKIIEKLKDSIKVNCTGELLNLKSKELMDEYGVFSSSKNYNGFNSYICVSVSNEIESEITHGVPNNRPFQNGDLVSIDVACFIKDENNNTFHGDSAVTVIVGEEPDIEKRKLKEKLLKTTKECLDFVVKQIKPGITTNGEIGKIIGKYALDRGFFTIKEYGGHGIGSVLHEEPFIPNFNTKNKKDFGYIIKTNDFICIEPLLQYKDNIIKHKIVKLDNNKEWMVAISKNNNINAHFEHTIFVSKEEAIIIS